MILFGLRFQVVGGEGGKEKNQNEISFSTLMVKDNVQNYQCRSF